MLKKLMIGAALSSLALSAAFAQSPMSPPKSEATPAAQSTTPTQASGTVVGSQQADQWVASKFKGTDVIGGDDQKLGNISDILFDKTGKIEAYVVSVGGFLGVGSKEVALPPNSFEVVPGTNGAPDKLKIAMSQNDLKQAQNFARYEPPRPTTTGMAPSGGSAPFGQGMRPSTNTPPSRQ
jgi:hypothetical protein